MGVFSTPVIVQIPRPPRLYTQVRRLPALGMLFFSCFLLIFAARPLGRCARLERSISDRAARDNARGSRRGAALESGPCTDFDRICFLRQNEMLAYALAGR